MTPLTHPITQKWPAQHPDRLQLYSLNTPNGVKASIMLEETGLPYEAHLVSFERNDQLSSAFLSLNPNNKIPAIIDPNGPGGQPQAQSGPNPLPQPRILKKAHHFCRGEAQQCRKCPRQ